MQRRAFLFLVVVVVSVAAAPAGALDQLEHLRITEEACADAGFPSDFCAVAGNASTNVDDDEWNDLAAHAQATSDEMSCDDLRAVVGRMQRLGAESRSLAADVRDAEAGEDRFALVTALGAAVGRAAHTVQDLCAHEGMTNVEHAWFSASDTCRGTTLSPDAQPAHTACAEAASADAFAVVRDAVTGLGVDDEALLLDEARVVRRLPSGGELCLYLASASEWDGVDRRWQLAVVQPLLLTSFDTALHGGDDDIDIVDDDCALAEAAAAVDVSGGAPWCPQIASICSAAGLGCAAVDAPDAGVLALLGLGLGLRRRRR